MKIRVKTILRPVHLRVRNAKPKECRQNKERKWHRDETEAIREKKRFRRKCQTC